jgi:hypothetical protein
VEELVFLGGQGDAESVANERMGVSVGGRHGSSTSGKHPNKCFTAWDRIANRGMRRRRGEDAEGNEMNCPEFLRFLLGS